MMSANFNHINNSVTLNAGVLKWVGQKIIEQAVDMIFSTTKSAIIEYETKKLVAYLEKHPEYIESTENFIMKKMEKFPNHKDKGEWLIAQIHKKLNQEASIE